jgi:spectinomycin phosphotransferase
MLTPPGISAETITARLGDCYGLRISQVTFLPIGADANAAVYRVVADDSTPYFLKLRRGDFDEIAVAVPAFLHTQGISQVMAPLMTTTRDLWASGHGFTWILYPYFEGSNGFEKPLSDAQWVTFGRTLKAVHSSVLPPKLARRAPREVYSPQWRDIVTRFDEQIETSTYADPVAQHLAAFWVSQRQDIRTMVERAQQLGQALRQRAGASEAYVLCHADIHAWNVLLHANDERELAIVDWDNPIFALKERDLMFIGGGVGAIWDSAREETLFYQGYGATDIDPVALSYYRYERIVEDVAAYGEQIFREQGSAEDREEGLRQLMGQFRPGHLVDIAHRTYERLA